MVFYNNRYATFATYWKFEVILNKIKNYNNTKKETNKIEEIEREEIEKEEVEKEEIARAVISGPNAVCPGSSASFTSSVWGSGYQWVASTNLSIANNTANPVSVSFTGSGTTAWVKVEDPYGGKVEQKELWIGKVNVTSISGPSSTPNLQYADFYANIPSGAIVNSTDYQWILNPQLNNNLYGSNTYHLEIAFYTAGSYQVVCRAYNSCGWGEYTVMGVDVY